jgi:nucleoside-diphosphate-sugar epimerase
MRTALVTGATGFIGGRLVERLMGNDGWKVRGLVRDYAKAARIARFDVEMVHGEIADPEAVGEAVRGCDVVFHCAYDAQDAAANLRAAEVLAGACVSSGVKRLVHVSSFSVYQPFPDGVLDEATPTRGSGWTYPDTKLEIERMLLQRLAHTGVEVVVVQPTVVYGPFGKAWTQNVARQLRQSITGLPNHGEGSCNAVYIDDVVDALIAAATALAAAGHRFLVSGPDPVTWAEFYGAFEAVLGVSALMPYGDEPGPGSNNGHEPRASRRGLRSAIGEVARRAFRSRASSVKWVLGTRVTKRLQQAFPAPPAVLIPRGELLDVLRSKTTVDITKARTVLGYEPRFTFGEGMARTRRFIEWARL